MDATANANTGRKAPGSVIGRTAWFWLDGFRSGRVRRVECGSRTGLRSVTVTLASGVVKRLEPRAFRGPLAGVMFRGALFRLEDLGAALRSSDRKAVRA